MPITYFSPGVYVEEIASGSAPIAGVGTSTAGFIGVIFPKKDSTSLSDPGVESLSDPGVESLSDPGVESLSDPGVESLSEPATTPEVYTLGKIERENVGIGDAKKIFFNLNQHPASTQKGTFKVKVNGTEDTNATITYDETKTKSQVNFTNALALPEGSITVDYELLSVPTQEVKLCTNFGEFKKFFGDFSEDSHQNTLAHAVYGFFRNGGTRCYVVWVTDNKNIDSALEQFEAIDEIAIVAAPGILSVREKIRDHCNRLGDRIAILDSEPDVDLSNPDKVASLKPFDSNYAALYFPWIQVLDPATNKEQYVPPSGHIAGIYARVDSQRGVHKAPANENLLGAVGLKYNISKAKQDGLNPQGINCIRNLNGNIKVWGARTLGGDANGEFKYINVRRLFNYLKKSIDEGTQWTVFEPNSPELWAKIRRNVTAFLMIVWRSGALFGNTPEQAFYVKCDEQTNPPELREQGQVVTEIGVAIVKPAEFVIFHLSQWVEPGK
jgi:hypothetical protein